MTMTLEKEEHTPLTSESAADESKDNSYSEPKVYARRWGILALFCFYSMCNSYQWIHLNVIFDVIKVYYNESLPASPEQKGMVIDWLVMIWFVLYVLFIVPAMWLVDIKGLRTTAILETLLNAVGTWIKCAAVSPDRFAVLMAAQVVCAIANLWILAMPARIAAVWFGYDQISTATAIGVCANQVGASLGFLISPNVVKLHKDDLELTGKEFRYLFYGGAGVSTLMFIIVVAVFREEPPQPPSLSQVKILKAPAGDKGSYFASVRRLMTNGPFILLVIAYGMNSGVYYSASTLLNPMILAYYDVEKYPHITEDVGWIGFSMCIAGIIGSFLAGRWLDKTNIYKFTTVGIYLSSLIAIAAFTFTLQLRKVWMVYLTMGLLGFFVTGYLPVGFEFGAELTYPVAESTSSGLLNLSVHLFGTILTLIMGHIQRTGDGGTEQVRASLLVQCGIVLVSTVLTLLIKNNLLRKQAEKQRDDDDGTASSDLMLEKE